MKSLIRCRQGIGRRRREMFTLVAPQAAEPGRETFKEDLTRQLCGHLSKAVVKLLALPIRPQDDISRDDTIAETKHAIRHNGEVSKEEIPEGITRMCFTRLPLELLNLIFGGLAGNDALSLSLCSHYLWSIGTPHIQNYHMSSLARWAGEKIVCVGDDIEAGDYPPGMFTDHEVFEFSHKTGENGQNFKLSPFTRGEFARGTQRSQITLQWELLASKEYSHMSEAMKIGARNLVAPDVEKFYPSEQSWVLRNLTTKEFVYAEKIALKPEYIHGPFIDVLGFCEVLMSRICWSTWRPGGDRWHESVHRGVWAGHCFEITTVGRHELVTKSEDWKDASEEVMKEIEVIWEIVWGAKWRQVVCDRFDRNGGRWFSG